LAFNLWRVERVGLQVIMKPCMNKDYFRDEPRQVAEALDLVARPGDKLLAWCYEPQIYTYSGLGYSPITTIWLYHLGKGQVELNAIDQKFIKALPRFIVLHSFREDPPPPIWLQLIVRLAYQRLPDAGGYNLYVMKPRRRF
jgi:hypothetical protein